MSIRLHNVSILLTLGIFIHVHADDLQDSSLSKTQETQENQDQNIRDKYVFFWLISEDASADNSNVDKSCFSQWYPSQFEICGVTFLNAEQFMMYCKAMCFNDTDSARAILETTDPEEIKKLGRGVQPFNVPEWARVAPYFVTLGNIAKFRQNSLLKEFLMSTEDKILVEASPYDKIWGIGLREEDPRAINESQWQGRNQLGKILMAVRNKLRENENPCQNLLGRFDDLMDLIQYIKENKNLE